MDLKRPPPKEWQLRVDNKIKFNLATIMTIRLVRKSLQDLSYIILLKLNKIFRDLGRNFLWGTCMHTK